MEGDSKSKTSFSTVCFFLPQKYVNHKNKTNTRFELCLIPYGNFSTLLKSDYCCWFKTIVGKKILSFWGEIRGIRSCRSHSELRKHQIVVEEDICVVSTKICRSCCLHDGILNDGMYAETLKIHLRKRQRFHLHLRLQQTNDHFSSFFVCKEKIIVSRTLSTRHFYCLRFSRFCFRLNSSIRNKTGTHVFWENGVDYPRVSLGAHPLTKKPEDSGYEIVK